MKQKKTWMIAGTAAIVLLAAAVIFFLPKKNEDGSETSGADSKMKTTAMYVPYGEDEYIMVDQENGTVFTVAMPEELYDIAGNKITKEELEKGNVLDIYGNGIMLKSYPGQYPGVSRINVVKTGMPSDADPYQNLIDQIYQEPDSSQVPYLNAEYRTETAAVTAAVTSGGYSWTYTDQKGESQSVVADTLHVLEWKEINDLSLELPVDVTLLFSENPQTVNVVRWPSELREEMKNVEIKPDGEAIEVKEDGKNYVLNGVEPGYVYLVTAEWENGVVQYGFLTKKSEN